MKYVVLALLTTLLLSCSSIQEQAFQANRGIASVRDQSCTQLMTNILDGGEARATRSTKRFQGKAAPLTYDLVVNGAHVETRTKGVLRELDYFGFGFVATNLRSHLYHNAKNGLQKISGSQHYGQVFKITKLPPTKKKRGYSVKAFEHPDFPEHVRKLEKMGISLVVDSSMDFAGMGAYFWSAHKVVSIKPTTTWKVFLHEFQHAEFNRYIERDFSKLKKKVIEGKSLKEILPSHVVSHFSEERVRRLESLMARDYTLVAADETMAVDVELRELGFRRYTPFTGSRVWEYALRHQVTELESIPKNKRSARQKASLKKSKRNLALTKLYRTSGESAVFLSIISAPVGALALYNEYGREPGDYIQIIYEEGSDRPSSGQLSDGTWVTFYPILQVAPETDDLGARTEIRKRTVELSNGETIFISETKEYDQEGNLIETKFFRHWSETNEQGVIVELEEELPDDFAY